MLGSAPIAMAKSQACIRSQSAVESITAEWGLDEEMDSKRLSYEMLCRPPSLEFTWRGLEDRRPQIFAWAIQNWSYFSVLKHPGGTSKTEKIVNLFVSGEMERVAPEGSVNHVIAAFYNLKIVDYVADRFKDRDRRDAFLGKIHDIRVQREREAKAAHPY
ncbi:hypothetical protein OIU34_21150 [Pararhizobium sp. BT-229]|uniref:hypothetical protein n=1 Tax=Pararhizobium sp. BT-229 TaxID=2986923 RepID=UPI0021F6CA04|nr:hypothetical protein [Pararhizobium sp. BT-229]MCV9964399.1 hypothetical protein [Pararhizobium sp. BT-229]